MRALPFSSALPDLRRRWKVVHAKKRWHVAIRVAQAVVGTIAALWLIYLVVANAVLASAWARSKVNGKPQVIQAEYGSAYTFVPGVFHMSHVSGWGQFTGLEYHGQIDHLRIDVGMIALLHHHVVLHIHASGVALQGKSPSSARRADPAIDAPVPLHPVVAPPVPVVDESLATWTIGVKLDVTKGRELWVDGARYDGPWTAKGSAHTTPNRSFDIHDLVVELQDGRVLVGPKLALPRLHARVSVNLDPVDPRAVDYGAFHRLSVDASVSGVIGDMRFMQDLATLPMTFAGDGGTFVAGARLDHGHLGFPAYARVTNHGIWVGFAGTGVGGAVDAEAKLVPTADGPVAKLTATVTRGEVTTAKGTPFVSIAVTRSEATATHLDLANPKAMRFVFDAHAPKATVAHLTVLDEYFSGSDFRIVAGTSSGRADVHGDFPKGELRGELVFSTSPVAVTFGTTKLRARLAGKVPIARASSESDFVLSGTSLRAENTDLDNADSHTRNWWGYLQLPRGTVRFEGETRYTGSIHATYRDIDPVITAIRKLHGVPDWVNRLLGIGPYDMNAIGTFGKHPKVELVDARAVAEGVIGHPHTRVRATYDGTRDPSRWVAEIDFGPLALGLDESGHHLGIQLAHVGRWFDEKAGLRPVEEPATKAAANAATSPMPAIIP